MKIFPQIFASPSDPKQKIFMGLCLIISAFIATIGVIYLLVDRMQDQKTAAVELAEQVKLLTTERDVLERQIEASDGRSVKLNNIVQSAQTLHGVEQEDKNEGALWIDHVNHTAVVTLGALNGLRVDSTLKVLNAEQEFDQVKVATLLDVIAYVTPVNRSFDDYVKDYYRVVYEE